MSYFALKSKDWAQGEIRELMSALELRKSPVDIAVALKRTLFDVVSKAEELGLWGRVIQLSTSSKRRAKSSH